MVHSFRQRNVTMVSNDSTFVRRCAWFYPSETVSFSEHMTTAVNLGTEMKMSGPQARTNKPGVHGMATCLETS